MGPKLVHEYVSNIAWPQNDLSMIGALKIWKFPLLGLEQEIRNFDMTNLAMYDHYIHVHDHDFNRGRTRSN